MATVIVSMLTGIPVRHDIAMTGEITLRGRVLPIGGLKEKLLAALRGGIKKVLIPEDNAKDLADIPDSVKNGLEIVPVARMEEVLDARSGASARVRSSGRRTSRRRPRRSPRTTTLRASSRTEAGEPRSPAELIDQGPQIHRICGPFCACDRAKRAENLSFSAGLRAQSLAFARRF